MLFMLLVAGCASRAPVAPATWVEVERGKAVCLSTVPGSAELGRRDERDFARAVDALRRARPDEATQALAELDPEHPAVASLSAVLGLVQGQVEGPVDALRQLVEAHPDDACLGSTTALALWAARDFEGAAAELIDARADAPDDAHVAFISWFLGLEPAAVLEGPLARGAATTPEDPGLQLALGTVRLELQEFGGAVPHLRAASEAGMVEADGPLLQASYLAGRRGEYLRVASRLGLPLGDDGAIAEAADPEAAYAEVLGMGEGDQLEAVLHTSMGDLTCALMADDAPITVANFVGLVRGTLPWVDPRTGALGEGPLYDGTVFHRVIPEFMIQGGDPAGKGVGNPGYVFMDELGGPARFDRPGVLAMANSGPHTNGSQFFVTEAPAEHLDGRHTIFGQCDEASVEVVREIARVETDRRDAPLEPVVLERVEIRVTGDRGSPSDAGPTSGSSGTDRPPGADPPPRESR